jgi:hypothetical protein
VIFTSVSSSTWDRVRKARCITELHRITLHLFMHRVVQMTSAAVRFVLYPQQRTSTPHPTDPTLCQWSLTYHHFNWQCSMSTCSSWNISAGIMQRHTASYGVTFWFVHSLSQLFYSRICIFLCFFLSFLRFFFLAFLLFLYLFLHFLPTSFLFSSFLSFFVSSSFISSLFTLLISSVFISLACLLLSFLYPFLPSLFL